MLSTQTPTQTKSHVVIDVRIIPAGLKQWAVVYNGRALSPCTRDEAELIASSLLTNAELKLLVVEYRDTISSQSIQIGDLLQKVWKLEHQGAPA
jgi:hypothetical protein